MLKLFLVQKKMFYSTSVLDQQVECLVELECQGINRSEPACLHAMCPFAKHLSPLKVFKCTTNV